MSVYDMRAVYTIAAVPAKTGPQVTVLDAQVAPLPTQMPYTLADAEAVAKRYNENPVWRGILKNHKYSHFVPFNIEALTMDPPPYYLDGGYA